MKDAEKVRISPLPPLQLVFSIMFPIVLLYASFLADLIGRELNHPGTWTWGGFLNLATLILGLVATLPNLLVLPTFPWHSD